MSKEQQRINTKREANEERRKRYLNARLRLIGQDVEGLNRQLEEKKQANVDKDEIDRLERKC